MHVILVSVFKKDAPFTTKTNWHGKELLMLRNWDELNVTGRVVGSPGTLWLCKQVNNSTNLNGILAHPQGVPQLNGFVTRS